MHNFSLSLLVYLNFPSIQTRANSRARISGSRWLHISPSHSIVSVSVEFTLFAPGAVSPSSRRQIEPKPLDPAGAFTAILVYGPHGSWTMPIARVCNFRIWLF